MVFPFLFLKGFLNMLPPHWLDEVFKNPKNAVSALTSSERFKSAIRRAQEKFDEAEKFLKENPKVVGPSAAQQARVEFLDAINES